MEFHKLNMEHMHSMESKLRPEMTVKPSALWQKRKVSKIEFIMIVIYIRYFLQGHQATSASYRGQQLVNFSKGKSGGDEIFAGLE